MELVKIVVIFLEGYDIYDSALLPFRIKSIKLPYFLQPKEI